MKRWEINAGLNRIAEGDERAFERLYEGIKGGVYSFAYSYLKNREDAEDAVQTVFLKIKKNAATFDKNGNEKTLSVKNTNQYLAGNVAAPDRVTVIGGKTGTTSAAGNCLILLARDTSGNPYIAVILKSAERGILYTEMNALLKQATS